MTKTEMKSSELLRTEKIISYVLRYGVLLCGFVIALGLTIRLAHIGTVPGSSRALISELLQGHILAGISPVHEPREILNGLISHSADVTMAAGLLLLIALPIVRVGMTVFLFLFERDWAFFVITLLVFSILLVGIVWGHAL